MKNNESQLELTSTDSRTYALALSAVFAALTFVGTFFIKFPIYGTSGYVHPGDAMVILCGVFLGKKKGFFAAGIGSALADLIGGYGVYIPATFVIKAVTALLAAVIFEFVSTRFAGKGKKGILAAVILAGLSDIICVPLGYLLFETVLYGFPAAAASALPNLGQAATGLVLATVLFPLVDKALKATGRR